MKIVGPVIAQDEIGPQEDIDMRVSTIGFDLDVLLKAAAGPHKPFVSMNFLELHSAKIKLDFLLSAITPAAAAE